MTFFFLSPRTSNRGFTMVELLIVIAIIGILATLAFQGFGNARIKARDAQRKSDLNQLRNAFELYKNDTGSYQITGAGYQSNGYGYINVDSTADSNYSSTSIVEGLNAAGYLPEASFDDPTQDPGYMVFFCNDYNNYALFATLEIPDSGDASYASSVCSGTTATGTFSKNYALAN